MLLRVWTAVLTAADASRSPGHAGPLARHVLLGVWDVRCRVLKLILDAASHLVEHRWLAGRPVPSLTASASPAGS